MSISYSKNIAANKIIGNLNKTNNSLQSTFEKLSSGQRINRASDDAAGLAIAESLKNESRVLRRGNQNLQDGISLLNVAESSVSELINITSRISELAQQAANGTYSTSQRKVINAEAQALSEEFTRISTTTEFNDKKLFDGTIDDGLSLQAGFGEQSIIQSSLGGVKGDGTFSLLSSYSQTNGAIVETADLNGDGNQDIISSSYNGGYGIVKLGNGDGTFQAGLTLDSATDARSISVADLNNDGTFDLLIDNANSEFRALIGNGDGTFQNTITYTYGAGNNSSVLEDLDGDGTLDLVTGSFTASDNISVAIGNGDGSFTTVASYTAGSQVRDITSGDFNKDGIADIATVSRGSNEMTVLLGTGGGNFQASVNYGIGTGGSAVKSGDINRDGYEDIITADAGGAGGFSILINNGDGSFQSAVTLNSQNLPNDMDIIDIDSDGNLDLVAGLFTTGIEVFKGNGDGTFSASYTENFGSQVLGISISDLNNDGVYDFVGGDVLNNKIDISLGNTVEGLAGINEFSLETQAEAIEAIGIISNKADLLYKQQGTIGAFQSRISFASNDLNNKVAELSNAESSIRDIDVASVAAKNAGLQVLQNANISILAQARQQPQIVLQLLS